MDLGINATYEQIPDYILDSLPANVYRSHAADYLIRRPTMTVIDQNAATSRLGLRLE
jgi:hypothetical protein